MGGSDGMCRALNSGCSPGVVVVVERGSGRWPWSSRQRG